MPAEILERPATPAAGFGGGGAVPPAAGRGGGEGAPGPSLAADPVYFGLLAFLGTVSMLFIGFTSAYIVRRSGSDWRPLAPPPLLILNTVFILASSGTLQAARARLRAFDLVGFRWSLGLTGLLGVLFLAGQLAAWQALGRAGVFLASNPHSSFFYLLTGLHGLHLAGGLAWFGAVLRRAARLGFTPGEDGLRPFATYWHFLAGLWIYLLWLLFAF